MKKLTITWVLAVCAAILSALLLMGTVALVSPQPKIKDKTSTSLRVKSSIHKRLSLSDTHAMIERVRRYNDCLESLPIARQNECEKLSVSQQNNSEPIETKRKPSATDSRTSGLILYIYIALWALLGASFFVAFDLLRTEPSLSLDTKEALMNYALSTPTLLGIAGTMYSMAMFASTSSSSHSLMATFRANITDAIGTTIAGIAVYLVAAAVFVWMHKKEGL